MWWERLLGMLLGMMVAGLAGTVIVWSILGIIFVVAELFWVVSYEILRSGSPETVTRWIVRVMLIGGGGVGLWRPLGARNPGLPNEKP